jgi:hypothetical protein
MPQAISTKYISANFRSLRVVSSSVKSVAPLLVCLLGLFAVNLIIFHDQWRGATSFTFDFPMGYYGTVAYWISAVEAGHWPQWIPYQSMGYPILMNPQMALFYPPFWIFVLLRLPYTLYAANIVQVLHVFFGSVGLFLLARSLFRSLIVAECGAMAFLFFGGFYTNAEHADIIRGFAWVPWLLWASLLRTTSRTAVVRGRTFGTRLDLHSFLLPALVYCFVTGAYMGQVIAGLLLIGVFLTVQAVQKYMESREQGIWFDLAIQYGLLALGMAMAAAFLIPGFYLTRELTRARGLGAADIWLLVKKDLFDLVFPSNEVHTHSDYSMSGMQVPLVLWLFVGLVRLKHLRALLPFVTIGAAAATMSFAIFAPFSKAVRHAFGVLALSRFPVADYREFFYLAILVLLLAGLSEAIQIDFSPWKKAALMLSVLTLFALLSLGFVQHDLSPNSLKPFLYLVKEMTWFGLATVAIIYAGSALRKPGVVGFVLPVSIVLSMIPVIKGAKVYWSDPDALKNTYETQGLPVAKVNAALRSLSVFHRHETSRPARKTAGDPAWLSWRGYLDGSYMTNDVGGVVSLSRARIEASPVLFRLMHEPSKLLRIDCGMNARACAGDPDGVVTDSLGTAGRSLEYSRDYVVYDVDVPVRSLIVENEVYIAGWHAVCDGKPLRVQRVDGSLRGWVVPAGHHRVRVYYQTPLLVPGSLVSIVAGLAAVLSFAWFRRLPSQN